MTETQSPFQQAALSAIGRGWPVFPCHTPQGHGCSCRNPHCEDIGKHPRTRHGLTDATTDEACVQRWGRQWPDANLAVVTGARSGLVVLDIDVHKGGEDSLSALMAAYACLPETVEVLTGSGGRHLYFAHPGEPVPNSVDKLGPGLDVRGDGGYVVAPPSLHACGRRYLWEVSSHPDEVPLAPLPPWLLALLRVPTGSAPSADHPETTGPICQGARNVRLFRLACAMRRHGAPHEAIAAALTITNQVRCQPPLEAGAVARIAASAARYVPGPPPTHPGYDNHWLGPRETWCGIPQDLVIRKVVIHG